MDNESIREVVPRGDGRQQLRALPPVNDMLAHPALTSLIKERGREVISDWIREELNDLRGLLVNGRVDQTRKGLTDEVVDRIAARVEQSDRARFARVINATGVVLHTGLGRAPLSQAARNAIVETAGASNLEVDVESGERRYRGYQLQPAWRTLTGAEDALVVNNNAAATLLCLQTLCAGREVVISRGQLIEIGGSFRLPEIFELSGAVLREVGTTNRTRVSDYERAIGPNTAAVMRVHPSNYRVVGFAETPEIGELAELARRRGLLTIDDIGSGCLAHVTKLGLPPEPTFQESVRAGADVVLGSGDKLLGGPQCGIVLGRRELIERLRSHPLARALRIDKLTMAALSATLDAYLRGSAEGEIPVLMLLAATSEQLLERARKIRENVRHLPALSVDVRSDVAPVGGGSLPGAELPTAVLELHSREHSADELSRRLRTGSPRVFGRIQSDRVLLDLRSVLPDDDARLSKAISAL